MPSKEQFEQDIRKKMDDIESLMKSVMVKADDPDKDKIAEQIPPPPAADQVPPPAADQVPPPPAADPASLPPAEGEPPVEGEPPAEPPAEDFDPASLSDDELNSMLEMLQAEKAKRESQPPAEGNDKLEMSMKKEFADLAKSVKVIAESVAALKQDMIAKPKNETPVQKPAAQNAVNVKPLEKSTPVPQKLSKSETIKHLLSEQGKGNKSIDSQLIATVNSVKDEDRWNEVYSTLISKGLLPK